MPAESTGRMGARTLGALQLAQPGCAVWSDVDKLRRVDNALGGIIVAIEDVPRLDDPVTAEVREARRAFKVWDRFQSNGPGRPAGGYLIIPEDACSPDSIEGLNHGDVTAATCQMARQYMDRRGKTGRRMLVGYDADLARHLYLLSRVLMGT